MNRELMTLLAQGGDGGGGGLAGLLCPLLMLLIFVLILIGVWKVFVKAGQPGWGCLIPILNVYLMVKIAGRPGWWFLLFFIPIVQFVMAIIVSIDIAKNFVKGVGYGLGLAFLGFIFWPLLGFGDAKYNPVPH